MLDRSVFKSITFAIVICLCAAHASVGAESQPFAEAVTVEGAAFKARLQSLSADGIATWELGGEQTKKLPLADLCWWGSWTDAPVQVQLVLVDGSLIVADVTGVDKERLSADWGLGGDLKLPLEWVGGIVLAPPVDRQQADLLRSRLLGANLRDSSARLRPITRPSTSSLEWGKTGAAAAVSAVDADRLILMNGDELGGEILALDENGVKIRTATGEVSVGKEKIAAVAFNPSLAAKSNPKELRLWVGFQDGSRLLASSLTVDSGRAKLKLAAGPQIVIPATKLCAVQPVDGHTKYLSDLNPTGYQQTPFLDLSWPCRTDRNVLGSHLRAGGRLFLKGLGMHSAARVNYDLDRRYRSFAAQAAIDDQTAGRGAALFRVYADDGSGKWQLRFESSIVRGGAAPLGISVDLKGVKRLSLLVDFADHGDEQAHADWLNARLLP